jgi:hypothetical protein
VFEMQLPILMGQPFDKGMNEENNTRAEISAAE